MRTHAIIVPSPLLDDDLRLAKRRKYLPVEQLIAQPPIEALDIAVLPRAAALDVSRARAHRPDPPLHSLGNELRPLVRADVRRYTAHQEQIGQRLDDVHRVELACHLDGQALARELVDDVEHAILPPVRGAVLDEVIGPHMVRSLRSKPNAGAVGQPKPASFRLPAWNLQPLAPPDASHPRYAHIPAGLVQQGSDPPVAVTAIGAGQSDDIGRQPGIVGPPPRHLALRRAVLSERRTGTALGYLQLTLNVLDALTPARGA